MQMKRPIVWMALPAAGIAVMGSAFHINFLFILFILILSFSFLLFSKILNFKQIIFLFIFSLISLIVISLNNQKPEAINRLEETGGYSYACIEGRVKKITVAEDNMKLILKNCTSADNEKTEYKGIILSCPVNDNIETGSIIKATGDLKPLNTARNYGNFNEREYYGALKIYSRMKTDEVEIVRGPDNIFYKTASLYSRYMKKSFMNISPDYEGSISSVILGDQSNLDPFLKELYKENGIAHLLAISGLHLSFAGTAIYTFLRRRGISFMSSAACAGFCVITYTVMTGSAFSAIRASVMFLFALIADITGRTYDAPSALSAQMTATLFIYPEAVCSASFLMSYMSVGSIMITERLFENPIDEVNNRNKKTNTGRFISHIILSDLKISLGIFIGLLPVNLWFYYETPLYSVLLNMIILPLAGILMGVCFLAGMAGIIFPPVGVFLISTAEYILDLYEYLCRFFSSLPYSSIVIGRPGAAAIIFYYILIISASLIFLFLRKKGLIKRSLFSLPLLILGFFIITRKPETDFIISMMDVGQGDSILVHTKDGKNLLFDGGSSDIENVYKYRAESFLKAKGISEIDVCFISHTDNDHISMISEMLDDCRPEGTPGGIHIKKIVLPDIDEGFRDENFMALERKAAEKNIPVTYAASGYETGNENFSVKCISPDKKSSIDVNDNDINALSAVYYYKDENISFLLTGDMTKDTEAKLLTAGKIQKAEILKGAHHGSNNSNTGELLEAVSPKLCIISCGVNNRYGHPGNETMERLEGLDIKTFVTKECGQIFVDKEDGKLVVRTMLKGCGKQ